MDEHILKCYIPFFFFLFLVRSIADPSSAVRFDACLFAANWYPGNAELVDCLFY